MLRHIAQMLPSWMSLFHLAGVWWSPHALFSTAEPLVMRTKSFAVTSRPPCFPPWIHSIRRATLRSGVMSNTTLVTFVSYTKSDALLLEPLDQRQDQKVVLVEACELDGAEIMQATEVLGEALHVELHLQRAMPGPDGEHRQPILPEVALEELFAHEFIEPLVV